MSLFFRPSMIYLLFARHKTLCIAPTKNKTLGIITTQLLNLKEASTKASRKIFQGKAPRKFCTYKRLIGVYCMGTLSLTISGSWTEV